MKPNQTSDSEQDQPASVSRRNFLKITLAWVVELL